MTTTNTTTANDNACSTPAWGSKAASVAALCHKDVAKLIRADIAAAVVSGLLPKGLKVSVRVPVYSMAKAIDLRVTAFAGVFVSVKRVRLDVEAPREFTRARQYTIEGQRVLDVLDALCNAYQSGHDDYHSDHFGERFSFGAEFHWELRAAQQKEIEAAIRATAHVEAPSAQAVGG